MAHQAVRIDFQVLQHRLADVQMHCEQVQAVAFFAAGVSAVKAFVGDALRAVAQDAVQLHGAMGITDELAIRHLFKHAAASEHEFGSVDYHLGQVTELGLPTESLAKVAPTDRMMGTVTVSGGRRRRD